jgi:hypothetical protein
MSSLLGMTVIMRGDHWDNKDEDEDARKEDTVVQDESENVVQDLDSWGDISPQTEDSRSDRGRLNQFLDRFNFPQNFAACEAPNELGTWDTGRHRIFSRVGRRDRHWCLP